MILINRKIYIVDNLSTKTLINIDIIKLEGIAIDIDKNLIIIELYDSLQVLVSIIIKGPRTNITVVSKVR